MLEYCTDIPLKIMAAMISTGVFFVIFYLLWRFVRPKVAWIWAISVPLALLVVQQIAFARDIPYLDDYHMVLGYLSQPFPVRIQHLFDFHGEHRLAVPRLLAEVINLMPGPVNFIVGVNVGNLFLLMFALMFGLRISRRMGVLFFVPFLFLALDLANYENTLFTLDAIQHYPVQFFALAAFVCLSDGRPIFLLISLISATFATFSSGAGVLVWPALLFISWKRCWWMCDGEEVVKARLVRLFRNREFICVMTSGIVTFLCYFQNFSIAAEANFNALCQIGLSPTHNTLWDKVDYVITACGGVVPIHSFAFPVGVVVFAMGAFVILNLSRIKDDAILGLASFELGITLSGALFRAKFGGGGVALMLRYGIISFSLIVSVIYLTSTLLAGRKFNCFCKMVWLAFAGSVAINFSLLLVGWELLENRTFCLEDGIRMNVPSRRNQNRPEYLRVDKQILEKADRLGIWHLK